MIQRRAIIFMEPFINPDIHQANAVNLLTGMMPGPAIFFYMGLMNKDCSDLVFVDITGASGVLSQSIANATNQNILDIVEYIANTVKEILVNAGFPANLIDQTLTELRNAVKQGEEKLTSKITEFLNSVTIPIGDITVKLKDLIELPVATSKSKFVDPLYKITHQHLPAGIGGIPVNGSVPPTLSWVGTPPNKDEVGFMENFNNFIFIQQDDGSEVPIAAQFDVVKPDSDLPVGIVKDVRLNDFMFIEV